MGSGIGRTKIRHGLLTCGTKVRRRLSSRHLYPPTQQQPPPPPSRHDASILYAQSSRRQSNCQSCPVVLPTMTGMTRSSSSSLLQFKRVRCTSDGALCAFDATFKYIIDGCLTSNVNSSSSASLIEGKFWFQFPFISSPVLSFKSNSATM